MSSVLITGANRGIGLGLVHQFLNNPAVNSVFATARNVADAKELQAISNPKLHLVPLTLGCDDSIKQAVVEVEKVVGDNGLDLLINNAGIFYRTNIDSNITRKDSIEQLEMNSVAPLMIAVAFRDLLKKAALKKGHAQIANISSTLGSIASANGVTPFTVVYSMSKAALNMLTRRISIEWANDNIRATSFCPGWVKTDMGSQAAMLTVEQSTAPLAQSIFNLKAENNGLFYNQEGQPIPW